MTGTRGPKSKPTAARLLDGTHRADRHGDPAMEPGEAVQVVLPPPDSLGQYGKRVWRETLPKIVEGGYFTGLDVDSFELYCRTYDEVAACDAAIKKDGRFYVNKKSGARVSHPAVLQRFRWLELQRRYAAAFWLTPTDRAGKQGAPKKKAVAKVQPRRRG